MTKKQKKLTMEYRMLVFFPYTPKAMLSEGFYSSVDNFLQVGCSAEMQSAYDRGVIKIKRSLKTARVIAQTS